jgi:hypothetical protein
MYSPEQPPEEGDYRVVVDFGAEPALSWEGRADSITDALYQTLERWSSHWNSDGDYQRKLK